MAVTKADVVRIAPEFATVSEEDFAAFIADATLEVSPDAWGPKTTRAIALLTAHALSLSRPGLGSGRVVQSEKVGPITTTYAVAAATGAGIEATTYGAEYLRLLRNLNVGAFVP